MSVYYIDTEFDGHGGALLSFAMVRDDDYSIHIKTNQNPADPWVAQNVMPAMKRHNADIAITGITPNEVGRYLRLFIGDDKAPIIKADSPVDIARFCQAISTDDRGNWASAEYPRMTFEVHNVDCYPTILTGAVQHNAWWDAKALKEKLTN